jgi:hypothetical protein
VEVGPSCLAAGGGGEDLDEGRLPAHHLEWTPTAGSTPAVDAIADPPSVTDLRRRCEAMLPHLDEPPVTADLLGRGIGTGVVPHPSSIRGTTIAAPAPLTI